MSIGVLMMVNKNDKGNTCGILGVVFSFILPLVGLVLGVISLARGERNSSLGIIAIVVSVLMWVLGFFLFLGLVGAVL